MNERRKDDDRPQIHYFDYKDTETLRHYLNAHGRIISRRQTKFTAKEQRDLARAVKNSREMGLLPYVVK